MTLPFTNNEKQLLNKVQFEAFSTMIRKDLEITMFHHRFISVVGEFDLFSKNEDELNSFDLMISLLMNVPVSQIDEDFQGKSSSVCIDDFLNLIIAKRIVLTNEEIKNLAEKYTNYIFKTVTSYQESKCLNEILILRKEYFLEEAGH